MDLIKSHEERIRQNNFLLEDLERKHRADIEKLNHDNNMRLRDIVSKAFLG